jgi:hypothetical protein
LERAVSWIAGGKTQLAIAQQLGYLRAVQGHCPGDAGGAEAGGDVVEVTGMHGPADEARRSEPLQAIWVGCIGLGGVRSDDLKIMPVAERKQGVARAAPRMDAAESRGNAGVLLDKGDPLVEVAGAE